MGIHISFFKRFLMPPKVDICYLYADNGSVLQGLLNPNFLIHVGSFPSLLTFYAGILSLQEYDVAVDNSKTPAEKLARQRQNLRHRLGC